MNVEMRFRSEIVVCRRTPETRNAEPAALGARFCPELSEGVEGSDDSGRSDSVFDRSLENDEPDWIQFWPV